MITSATAVPKNRSPQPAGWDAAARGRLLLIYLGILLPVAAIFARVAYVQTMLPDRFVTQSTGPTESLEPIPCRTGQILTSDGLVLATDEPSFAIALEYRWFEDPPNEPWLRSQARERLPARSRTNRTALAAARQDVLNQREDLITALAEASGRPRSQITERCRRVQERVQRVYDAVNRQRQPPEIPAAAPIPPGASAWQRAWRVVRQELTTPPQRQPDDPLVIREQLEPHVIIDNVPVEVARTIAADSQRHPGVTVHESLRRRYPQRDLAAHFVGLRSTLSDEEFAAEYGSEGTAPHLRALSLTAGRSGMEQACDARLRGRPGWKRVVRDRTGAVLHSEVVEPPRHGSDITLSCDSRLQSRAEELLDAALQPRLNPAAIEPSASNEPPLPTPQGACIVALDVHTGRVLVAAAAPRFDAQLLVDYDDAPWQQLLADPRRPFFPRATELQAAPGSIFKVISSVALLESRAVDPDALLHCRGYLDHPDRDRCLIFRRYGAGHGDIDLSGALCQSCNVYFFDAARRMGPAPLADWALRFGLGAPTGSEFPGERSGHIPHPAHLPPDERWSPGMTLQLAIGQATVAVTPLQVARMMAAIANGGELVTPQFTIDRPPSEATERESAIQLVSHSTEWDPAMRQRIPGLSTETLRSVREGLERVVADPQGTGRRAALDEIAIAGKTGTAETGGGRPDHAWFAGYVPADKPKIAFVVLLEHAGAAGQTAAPLAAQFVRELLESGMIAIQRHSAAPVRE